MDNSSYLMAFELSLLVFCCLCAWTVFSLHLKPDGLCNLVVFVEEKTNGLVNDPLHPPICVASMAAVPSPSQPRLGQQLLK